MALYDLNLLHKPTSQGVKNKMRKTEYLVRQHRTWSVRVRVPDVLRPILNKNFIWKTTGERDLVRANRAKQPILQEIFEMFDALRDKHVDPDNKYLSYVKQYIAETKAVCPNDEDMMYMLRDSITDTAYEIYEDTGSKAALEAVEIGFGDKTPIADLLEPYKDHRVAHDGVATSTVDNELSLFNTLLENFRFIHELEDADAIEDWLMNDANAELSIITKRGKVSSIRQLLSFHNKKASSSFLRGVPDTSRIPKARRMKSKTDDRVAFTDEQLIALYNGLRPQDDNLRDLIKLSAYSGMRISEICNMPSKDVHTDYFDITNSKTAAGVRQVPIHSKIKQLVARLLDQSKDGYLISGLSADRYGDRSRNIGRRFSERKITMGFSDQLTFHSIRHTFITQLAYSDGVSEVMIASIVGHEFSEVAQTVSFGTYTSGATLDQKRDVVELISYTGW